MSPPSRALLAFALILSLCCAALGAGGIIVGLRGQSWYVLAFQAVLVLTAVPGVLVGLRVIRSGEAITMLCIGGVACVGALLSEPTLVSGVIQGSGGQSVVMVGGVNIVPWALAQVGIGVMLVSLAGLCVLLRRPGRSFPLLLKGVLAGLPIVVVVGAMIVPNVRGMVLGLPVVAQLILAIVSMAVLGALCAMSGHCLIRAFEVGIVPERASEKERSA